MKPIVEIDPNSGFCFGVVKAINAAEQGITQGETLYSIGHIVHNALEVERLQNDGLKTIAKNELSTLSNNKVLMRAHGEPPETYKMVADLGLQLIDATCPVVLKLQQRIKKSYEYLQTINGQLLIYGNQGHAEVVGLEGQTNNTAIVIESMDDLHKVDLNRPIHMYAQTTKSIDGFKAIDAHLQQVVAFGVEYKAHNTICQQVAGRVPKITAFAQKYAMVLFVGGATSSNAKMLFQKCKQANPNSYFITAPHEIMKRWLTPMPASIGICGATSTPQWLMEGVKQHLDRL